MRSHLFTLSSMACSLLLCCQSPDRVYLELSAPPGGLALYAVASSGGRVEHVGVISENGLSETAAPESATILTWLVEAGSMIDPSGAPLSSDDMKRMAFHVGPAVAGEGCGRCLAPPDGDRWILHPGSSCPVPHGLTPSAYRLEGSALVAATLDNLAEVSAQVRLSRPGACACAAEPPRRGSTEALLVCPLTPEGAEWPVERSGLVLAPEGRVGMFSKHRGALLEANGTLHETREFPPFVRQPSAVVALPTPRGQTSFLVMDRVKGSDSGPPRVFEWSPERGLETQAWTAFDPGLRVVGARWTSNARDRLIVFGRTDRATASFPALSEMPWANVNPGDTVPFLLSTVEDCGPAIVDSAITDLVVTSTGTGVAVMANGIFAFRASVAAPWRCEPSFAVEHLADHQAHRVQSFQIESIGSWVYVCGGVEVEDEDTWTLFGFDTAPLREGARADELELRDFSSRLTGVCNSLAPTPEGDRLLASDLAGRVVELRGTSPSDPLEHDSLWAALGVARGETELPMDSYRSAPDGSELIANAELTSLWTRGTGGAPFERKFGPTVGPSTGPYAFAAAPPERVAGSAVLFRGPGAAPLAIDDVGAGAGCERFVAGSLSFTGGSPVEVGTEIDFALHTERSHYLLFTRSSTGGGRALFLDLEVGEKIRDLELPSELGAVVAAAELNPRTVVAFGATGAVVVVENTREPERAEVALVPPIWDDPRSPASEEPPGMFHWMGVTVSQGVGWAHGTNVLARVLPDGDGAVRLEGYWLSRASFGPFADADIIRRAPGALPAVSAIELGCPDSALLLSVETETDASDNLMTNRVYSWRLGPESTCMAPSARLLDGGLEICDTAFFSRFRFTDDASEGVTALLSTSTGLLNLLGDGSIHGDGTVYPLPQSVRSAFRAGRSDLLFYTQKSSDPRGVERVGVVAEVK